MNSRNERLFERAEAILDGNAVGLGEPVLWHLALRKFGPAMLELANRSTQTGTRRELGRTSDAFSPAGMTYHAWRQGEPNAAQNMAMGLFNAGDMAGYRLWMHKAARAGDTNALEELRRFETRQPHNLARRLRRLRPHRRDRS
jgi:hypothetical protein